jgi:hypothetical protein
MPIGKDVDWSEGLAITGAVLKLAQIVGESYGLPQDAKNLLSGASVFLLFASVFVWLRTSRKRLEKIEGISEKVKAIDATVQKLDPIAAAISTLEGEFKSIDTIARYGAGGTHLAKLLRTEHHVFGKTGGQTLSDVVLDLYSRAAQDLHGFTTATGNQHKVELSEYHVVDKFLFRLINALPIGTVWLGATRLQSSDAWTEGIAEPSYFQFDYVACQRTSAKTMRYLRLWCFDSLQRQEEARDVMLRQMKFGIEVKALRSQRLKDFSIIWVPKEGAPAESAHGLDTQQLFNELALGQRFQSLCGIEFRARGGKELDAMTLYGPGHDEFRSMFSEFVSSWQVAEVPTHSAEASENSGRLAKSKVI